MPRGNRHQFRNIADDETHMVAFYTPCGDDPVPGPCDAGPGDVFSWL